MHLLIYRELKNCTKSSTPGRLYINGHFFSYTLEDALRHPEIKVAGETCIPCCTLDVDISRSNRFNRDMLIFSNQTNGYEAIINGHSWTGLRAHGGNDCEDTHGCLLVAENRLNNDKIQGTKERDLTQIVKDALDGGEEVKATWVLV